MNVQHPPITVGITLDHLSVLSTDYSFKPSFITEPHSVIYKVMKQSFLIHVSYSRCDPFLFMQTWRMLQSLFLRLETLKKKWNDWFILLYLTWDSSWRGTSSPCWMCCPSYLWELENDSQQEFETRHGHSQSASAIAHWTNGDDSHRDTISRSHRFDRLLFLAHQTMAGKKKVTVTT